MHFFWEIKMAEQEVTELTEETTPIGTDMVYLVGDPGGTPVDRKLVLWRLLNAYGAGINLIKNSPGQIVVDASEPQWWDDSTNATLTDEDTVGESIPDKTERVFKVVTTADNEYGYQTLTFSDEDLLDAGQTILTLSVWVYCATANKASIGIYGTNLGLQESSQAGASAWELLTVDNITLNASDTSIEVRLIVDTSTAYFTMPMLSVGTLPMPWQPRRERYVPITGVLQVDLSATGDVAWTSTDCTSNTDPLATGVDIVARVKETDGTLGSAVYVGHASVLVTDFGVVRATSNVINRNFYDFGSVRCDDGQNIRYTVLEQDADSDVLAQIYITGYWRWE
jgi:hypothetical protein